MMKYFLVFIFMSLFTSSYSQEKAVDLTFDKKHIELGDVYRGETKKFSYTFINTGTESVEISIVSGCDCSTLSWTKGKIQPGEKGIIDVIFDSTEKEESEVVDVDLYLTNIDPKWNASYLFVLDFTFELIQKK